MCGDAACYVARLDPMVCTESEPRKNVIAAGGMWGPSKGLWFLAVEEVRKLGLVQRVPKR